MKILPVSIEAVEEAVRIIKNGGIVAHATETCYGFACDLSNPEAVAKLYALKERPLELPVSALFPSVEESKKYVQWNEEADQLGRQELPGPLTIVLPLKVGALSHLGWSSLGVRVSSHPIALELAEKVGVPLSTTSANLHGQPNPYSVSDIEEQFSGKDHKPDLILDSGTLDQNTPSTVVALIDGKVEILREGSIKPSF
jgi:L-threonylcarbamoyladenylate synthase